MLTEPSSFQAFRALLPTLAGYYWIISPGIVVPHQVRAVVNVLEVVAHAGHRRLDAVANGIPGDVPCGPCRQSRIECGSARLGSGVAPGIHNSAMLYPFQGNKKSHPVR